VKTEDSPHIQTGDPDQDLVQALRRRDPNAAADLVRRLGSRMYASAVRIVRAPEDAEEVVQDALLAIWRHAHSFAGQSKFSTWATRITINCALQHRRREGRRPVQVPLEIQAETAAEAPFPCEPHTLPEHWAIQQELGQHLNRCMSDLPERMRMAVILKDVEGLNLEECARLQGVSIPAFKSRLHRARLSMRKCLLPLLPAGQGGSA